MSCIYIIFRCDYYMMLLCLCVQCVHQSTKCCAVVGCFFIIYFFFCCFFSSLVRCTFRMCVTVCCLCEMAMDWACTHQHSRFCYFFFFVVCLRWRRKKKCYSIEMINRILANHTHAHVERRKLNCFFFFPDIFFSLFHWMKPETETFLIRIVGGDLAHTSRENQN